MNNKKKVLINCPLTILRVGPIYQRLVNIKMQLELKTGIDVATRKLLWLKFIKHNFYYYLNL